MRTGFERWDIRGPCIETNDFAASPLYLRKSFAFPRSPKLC